MQELGVLPSIRALTPNATTLEDKLDGVCFTAKRGQTNGKAL
jgi:hypothetical protein